MCFLKNIQKRICYILIVLFNFCETSKINPRPHPEEAAKIFGSRVEGRDVTVIVPVARLQ